MKQVYAKAKECKEQITAEDFAVLLAKHFTSYYKQVALYILSQTAQILICDILEVSFIRTLIVLHLYWS